MMMVDPELDALRREFLTEACEKMQEIAKALGSDRDAAALERVSYLAHQLKGSGGSYGFQRISTDAAELEKAIERLTGGLPDGAEDEIQKRVGSLRSEIDQRTRELAGM